MEILKKSRGERARVSEKKNPAQRNFSGIILS